MCIRDRISNLIPLDKARQFAPALLEGHTPGSQHLACVRPEDVRIAKGGRGAHVKSVQFLGNISRVQLDWEGGALVVEEPGETALTSGTEVGVTFSAGKNAWVLAS